jgi:hypothetical protein
MRYPAIAESTFSGVSLGVGGVPLHLAAALHRIDAVDLILQETGDKGLRTNSEYISHRLEILPQGLPNKEVQAKKKSR